ncbi:DUF6452 family protein [Chryseolinea lacunae]|uniref:Uncharacterized protein n=1 Tax=Chryseolinea lacunae TaxID=2801331 RepID=A0ABS1KQ48_9BACT|nr:DUF6452 family protein [Chryseolinea lacunae]MBL0741556.1 hypothetical protein [Chryseolinea lacunae]
MNKVAWFIFLALAAFSCLDQPDCFRLDNSEYGIKFRVIGYGSSSDTLASIVIDGTGIVYAADTVPVTNAIALPLSPARQELSYTFTWKNGKVDRLHLGYKAQIQFVSQECGQRYVFTDLTVLETTFDSTHVFNAKPVQPVDVNIEIFRCAKPDHIGVNFKKLLTQIGTTTTTRDSLAPIKAVTAFFRGPNGLVPQSVYLPNDTLKEVFLPLSADHDTARYEFDFGSVKKNLVMIYRRELKTSLIQSCGRYTVFAGLKVGKTVDWDSTIVKTKILKTVTNDPAILNLEVNL